LFDNVELYITYCCANKDDPLNAKALKDFLIDKQLLTGKLIGDLSKQELILDTVALLKFAKALREHAKYSKSGYGVAFTIGLYINDLGDFLNDFTPAQIFYYEHFLKRGITLIPEW
jgi:hypothetical protein